jgi:hypothetical protein
MLTAVDLYMEQLWIWAMNPAFIQASYQVPVGIPPFHASVLFHGREWESAVDLVWYATPKGIPDFKRLRPHMQAWMGVCQSVETKKQTWTHRSVEHS